MGKLGYEICPSCNLEYPLQIKEEDYNKITKASVNIVCCECFKKLEFIRDNPGIMRMSPRDIVDSIMREFRNSEITTEELIRVRTKINKKLQFRYPDFKVEFPLLHLLIKFKPEPLEVDYVNECYEKHRLDVVIVAKNNNLAGLKLLR